MVVVLDGTDELVLVRLTDAVRDDLGGIHPSHGSLVRESPRSTGTGGWCGMSWPHRALPHLSATSAGRPLPEAQERPFDRGC